MSELTVEITGPTGSFYAVKGVSLTASAGQRIGLVGESGSGKSLSAMAIMRLLPRAARIESGQVLLQGRDILQFSERDMAAVRGRRIAMVSQDPMSALNPLQTIGKQITEALRLNGRARRTILRARAAELLREVGLSRPQQRVDDYPHQLSGGMRQRVALAVALARAPDILIADEPTTALDVTTQARIVRLLLKAVADRGLAVIFITHDLALASEVCTDIHVLYGGRMVEVAAAASFFARPIHPYSEGLLGSVCGLTQPLDRPLPVPSGTPPAPGVTPPGCLFHPRCPLAAPICHEEVPPKEPLVDPGSFAACHFARERLGDARLTGTDD